MPTRILWIALLGLLLVVVMGMVVVVAQQTGSRSSTAWESLSPEALENELGKSEMVIVDLREPELYRNGHIPGAINIPFYTFQARYRELDSKKRIVFVCHTGPMGEASAQFLVEKGYARVANLEGGMARWRGPVTR